MATYSEVILELRKAVQDLERSEFDTFDGDGNTSKFVLSHDNIVDSTYIVKVSSVTQTETTHYTINKDSGEVTFVSAHIPASGNDNVTVEYRYTKVRDDQYIEMLNEAVDAFEQDLWETALDDSTLTTTANAYEISLASISANVLFVIDAYYKTSSASTSPWISLNSVANVKFLKDQNKVQLNPPFTTDGYPLKFWYGRKFTKATTLAGTFAPPQKFWTVYKFEVKAKYLERLAFARIHETSVIVKEGIGYTPSDLLFREAERLRNLAKDELKKVRPKRPPKTIPILVEGFHS